VSIIILESSYIPELINLVFWSSAESMWTFEKRSIVVLLFKKFPVYIIQSQSTGIKNTPATTT